MSLLWILVIAVVVLLAALLALTATRPATFRIHRAAVIQAPPEKIYPFMQ